MLLLFTLSNDTNFIQKSPTKAIMLSTIIPGSGQFYNGKKTKAFIIGLLDASSTTLFIYNVYQYRRYRTENYYWASIGYIITFLGIKMFSIVDAYIDANVINAGRSQKIIREKSLRF